MEIKWFLNAKTLEKKRKWCYILLKVRKKYRLSKI